MEQTNYKPYSNNSKSRNYPSAFSALMLSLGRQEQEGHPSDTIHKNVCLKKSKVKTPKKYYGMMIDAKKDRSDGHFSQT